MNTILAYNPNKNIQKKTEIDNNNIKELGYFNANADKNIRKFDLDLEEIKSLDDAKSMIGCPRLKENCENVEDGVLALEDEHSTQGLLANNMPKNYERKNALPASLFGQQPKVFNQNIFAVPPRISDIVQSESLDCGFLASIASIMASKHGSTYIETLLNDNVESMQGENYSNVEIQMYGENSDRPTLVTIDKRVDQSTFYTLPIFGIEAVRDYEPIKGTNYKFPICYAGLVPYRRELTKSDVAWVHLLERCFKTLYTPREFYI